LAKPTEGESFQSQRTRLDHKENQEDETPKKMVQGAQCSKGKPQS